MDWRVRIGRWGGALIPGEAWMRWTFLVLLALAATLRIWRLWHMPFMHDELSALVRLYPTLWETIERGVIELDTHPPGVQVFEWLWTRLFGTSELAVKLPFVLMSLGALLLLYRVAMAWTSATSALLLTALLATLQYSVLYGQLARPYAAGLFTTALFADQLTRWLAQPQLKQLIWMGVAALLSAYTHHFALLLVGLMGLSGLLLASPEQRRPYLIMATMVVVGYLPNVPIFLTQLQQGGLDGWLAPPDSRWVLDHAWWVAHCSWWLAAPLLALALSATVRLVMHGTAERPALPLLLLWGLAPMLLGLAYSVWRAPVLQHSVLLFSFPYLLMALLLGLGELGRLRTMLLSGVFALLATATLISKRQHYHLLYHSKYESMLLTGNAALAALGPERVALLFDAPKEQLDFYMKHWSIAPEQLPHTRLRENGFTPCRLDSLLQGLTQDLVVYGQSNGAPNEQLARIQLRFPHIVERVDLAEGQVFVLSRTREETSQEDRVHLAGACPDCAAETGWDIHQDMDRQLLVPDSLQCWDFSGREFGAAVRLQLDSITRSDQDQVEIRARLHLPAGARNVGLVVELKHADSTVFYRTAEFDDLRWNGMGDQVTMIVAARPGDANLHNKPLELVAYLYNRDKSPVCLLGMDVQLRAANPVVYGITGPIDGEWVYRPE
jgi:hypothetical protein